MNDSKGKKMECFHREFQSRQNSEHLYRGYLGGYLGGKSGVGLTKWEET